MIIRCISLRSAAVISQQSINLYKGLICTGCSYIRAVIGYPVLIVSFKY